MLDPYSQKIVVLGDPDVGKTHLQTIFSLARSSYWVYGIRYPMHGTFFNIVYFPFADIEFKVYIWDLPDEYNPALIEWNSYYHDRYHSGLYEHKIPLEVPRTNGYHEIQTAIDAAQAGDFVEVDPLRYNPIPSEKPNSEEPVLQNDASEQSSSPAQARECHFKRGIDIIWSVEDKNIE